MASWNSLAIISRFSRTMAHPGVCGCAGGTRRPYTLRGASEASPSLTLAPRRAAEPGGGRPLSGSDGLCIRTLL